MTFDERLPSDSRQEDSSEEEPKESATEEDLIPLQRCPHLYIKYTPEKGKSVTSLSL